jgi:hypothetical protein
MHKGSVFISTSLYEKRLIYKPPCGSSRGNNRKYMWRHILFHFRHIFLYVVYGNVIETVVYRPYISNPTFHGPSPLVVRHEFSLPEGNFPLPTIGVNVSPLFVYTRQSWQVTHISVYYTFACIYVTVLFS